MKLHDRYGNMVRIGPDYLAIDGSIGWKDVYGHKNFGQPEFSKNAHYFPPAESKGNFIVSRQEDHRRIRRLLAHAFSDKALQEQESIIKSYVDLLITRLKQHQGQIIDMCRWYNFTTFDLIGDLAFGDSFQCLATEALHPWVFMIFKMIKVVSIFRFFTEYPFLQPLLNILITKKQDQDRKDHLAFVRNKAMSRVRAGESQRKDFMTYILRHNDEKGMSPDEIVAASNVMIIAGSETTATLLSGFTYYILKHPRVYNKLIEQIRTTFEREEEITILSVNKMEYLLACLDEALRIYPPVAEQVSRISPGDNVDGQYVPEGVSVPCPSVRSFCSLDYVLTRLIRLRSPFINGPPTTLRATLANPTPTFPNAGFQLLIRNTILDSVRITRRASSLSQLGREIAWDAI